MGGSRVVSAVSVGLTTTKIHTSCIGHFPSFFFFFPSVQLSPSRCNDATRPTRPCFTMDVTKLELYGSHHSDSNGLANMLSTQPRAASISASDSDSEEDHRDGARKRKRPMNVTYVLAPSDPICLLHLVTSFYPCIAADA